MMSLNTESFPAESNIHFKAAGEHESILMALNREKCSQLNEQHCHCEQPGKDLFPHNQCLSQNFIVSELPLKLTIQTVLYFRILYSETKEEEQATHPLDGIYKLA